MSVNEAEGEIASTEVVSVTTLSASKPIVDARASSNVDIHAVETVPSSVDQDGGKLAVVMETHSTEVASIV